MWDGGPRTGRDSQTLFGDNRTVVPWLLLYRDLSNQATASRVLNRSAILCLELEVFEVSDGAADLFLEMITQPFLGFVCIVPDSSKQATV